MGEAGHNRGAFDKLRLSGILVNFKPNPAQAEPVEARAPTGGLGA
jgi:hypothetical protein